MLNKLITKLILWLERFTYQELTVDNANKKLIEPVHGLKVNGQQLYKYKSDLDIPVRRKVALSGVHKYFGASISVKQVVEFLNQIREANNDNDKSRVGLLAYSLQDMLTTCTDDEGMYRMAAIMFFTRDEDHSQFDNDIMMEKVNAFRKLKGTDRDFFLRTLLKHLDVSSESSVNDILTNMRKSKVKLMAYQQLLSEGSSPKSSVS